MQKDIIEVIGKLEKIEYNYEGREDYPHSDIENALSILKSAIKDLNEPVMASNANEYESERHGLEQV